MDDNKTYEQFSAQSNEQNKEQLTNVNDYNVETATEFDPSLVTENDYYGAADNKTGRGVGYASVVISLLALFVMPLTLGIVGIIVGFIARARGAASLGSWAIGIGIVAIVLKVFFAPLSSFTFI